jgi:hypothetical protein
VTKTDEQAALELEVLTLYANMAVADYRLEHCKTDEEMESVNQQVTALGHVIDELIARDRLLKAEQQRDETIEWLLK